MTPGKFLRDARIANGWNQHDVAYALGMDASVISWIETNRRKRLDFATAIRLCKHYAVSLLVLAALVEDSERAGGG